VTITKQQTGFTLIELAVVVFLIGLLASMGFGAFKAQMMNASIRATQGNQGAIKDALMAYLAKNKRLPCPATPATQGAEGRDTTPLPPNNCFTYYGLVPYQELDLTKSVAMDGWDNFFTYGVSPQWTATYSTLNDRYNTTTAANAFNVGVPGVITVDDMNQTSGSAVPVTTTAAAVVISQGVNGYGAYTSKGTQNDSTAVVSTNNEHNNIPPSSFSSSAIAVPLTPPTYFKRDYTSNTAAKGGAFDDVVMVLNPSDLLTPLMRDGALKSAQGQWADQVTNIKNWVVDYAVQHCIAPPLPMPPIYATGPWGETVTYAPYSSQLHFATSPTPATTPLYTLTDTSAIPSTLSGPTAGWLLGAYPYLTTQCP